jgi:transposase
MLKKQYCEAFGRPAKEPEMMFKLMFLKKLYDLSDVRLISQAQTDMAYKYFLNLDPEDEMVDPSPMTKFRKTRITEDILEEMLKETIRQAIEKGIIKSNTIIVDSTHTNANVRAKTVTQVLRELSRELRKEFTRRYMTCQRNSLISRMKPPIWKTKLSIRKNCLKAFARVWKAVGTSC